MTPDRERKIREKILENVWRQIDDVGRNKAVGYLPINTLENHLKRDLDEVEIYFSNKGIKTRIVNENESFVEGGALYVYSFDDVFEVICRYQDIIVNNQLKPDVDSCIDFVSCNWIESEGNLRSFINALFEIRQERI